MKRLALTCMSLLATGLLACGEVHAQARSPVSRESKDQIRKGVTPADAAARSRKIEEMEVWLRRLVGHFQVKGTIVQHLNNSTRTSRGINGAMECASIGNGPGVHCLIRASWQPIQYLVGGGRGIASPTLSEMYNTLDPAILLFALDPDDLRIKVLLVDDHSIADDLSGVLTGDRVELVSGRKGCWGPLEAPRCPWGLVFTAKPDSNVIQMAQTAWKSPDNFIEVQLRRVPGPTALEQTPR